MRKLPLRDWLTSQQFDDTDTRETESERDWLSGHQHDKHQGTTSIFNSWRYLYIASSFTVTRLDRVINYLNSIVSSPFRHRQTTLLWRTIRSTISRTLIDISIASLWPVAKIASLHFRPMSNHLANDVSIYKERQKDAIDQSVPFSMAACRPWFSWQKIVHYPGPLGSSFWQVAEESGAARCVTFPLGRQIEKDVGQVVQHFPSAWLSSTCVCDGKLFRRPFLSFLVNDDDDDCLLLVFGSFHLSLSLSLLSFFSLLFHLPEMRAPTQFARPSPARPQPARI